MTFYTFILLNRKLRLGSFRKAFPNYKGGRRIHDDECLVIVFYFSKDGKLLMLKVKVYLHIPKQVSEKFCRDGFFF